MKSIWFWFGIIGFVGLLAGTASGLLGIGSGIVMVPILSAMWSKSDPDAQKVAQGTALAVMVPIAIAGAMRYHFGGDITNLRNSLPLAVWGWVGGFIVLMVPLLLSRFFHTGEILGNVEWRYVVALAIGGVVGTMWIGSPLANHLPVDVLKKIFGIFMIFVGLRMAGVFDFIWASLFQRSGG